MPSRFTSLAIIAPLAVATVGVCAADDIGSPLLHGDFIGNPFELDVHSLDPIRFSRIAADSPAEFRLVGIDSLTEVSFAVSYTHLTLPTKA